MTHKPKDIGVFIVCVFIAWLAISHVVFAIRHPWATDTERLLCSVQALTFQRVPYEEMRPRE